MSEGRTETHKDDEHLLTGTHDAGTSDTLRNVGADFKAYGVMVGLFVENVTQSTSGHVKTVTADEITVDGITGTLLNDFVIVDNDWTTSAGVEWADSLISWDNSDTYKIYKTAVKGCTISTDIVDLSRDWKTDPANMERGWRKSDVDIDRDGQNIFGPGQPEKGH